MSTYITPAFLRFISYLTETRVTVLLVLMGLIIIPFFSSSSASSSKQTFLVAPALTSGQISAVLAPPSAPSFGNILTALMPQNPQEGIETYAADCATPRSDFALG